MTQGKDAKYDNEAIQSACRDFLRTALGGPDSDVGRARERNLRAYNAEPWGDFAPPEVEDRSDFVSTDVADTVEGMLPQIMRLFVASDDAVEFEDRKPQAEPQGKLATAYVNHQFYVRNDGVGVIHDWFKDALIQKVGFVKVWAEEESEDSRQTFEGQSEEQLILLLQDGYTLDGDPQVDEVGGLTFTVTKEDRRVAIKCAVCPPHEVRVDANARWGEDPAAIGHLFRKRRFELEEAGHDLTDIGASSGHTDESEALEMLGPDADSGGYGEAHESHKTYQCAEVYIRLDKDGDGIAEWLRCYLIEDVLVECEQVDDHPFVWVCPIPRPHAFFGDCPADFAYQAQVLNTRTIRAIQDNMVLTVNQRTYINTEAGVNIDDMVDSRPGGIVRGMRPPSDAIQPIAQPSLGAPAYQFLETINVWKENRTGFTRYSQGMDADSLNKTATGVSIITQKADMRMELMSRFFAVGMKQLFRKILKLSIRHQRAPDMVALNGEFVPINPSEWRDEFNLTIKVGLGTGTKEQQAARIMALAQIQNMGVQAGIVQPKHLAETIRLYIDALELKNPERFVDPEPSGMPPNPQAYQQEKQGVTEQMQKMQEELQRVTQENESLKAEKGLRLEERELKHREIDIQERQFEAGREDAANAPEQRTADAEVAGAEALMQAAAAIAQAMQMFAQVQAAPRTVQMVGPSGQTYTAVSAPATE